MFPAKVLSMSNLWKSVAMIIGTCIGAGILALPKAFTLSGFFPAVVLLIILAWASTLMNLFVSEVTLRTKKEKQVVGLAEIYLGKIGKYVMLGSVIIGMFGALTAYTIAIGDIGKTLTGISNSIFFIILTFIAYLVISKGVKMLGEVESILITVMILFILVITVVLGMNLNIDNLKTFEISNFFLPYGALFFALMSYSVVPEVEELMKDEKNKLYRASIYAMIICTIIYIIFPLVFISEFGTNVSEIATESLTGVLGLIGNMVAILTMCTSYFAIGVVLRDIIGKDMKFGKGRAAILVCLVPFLISLFVNPGFLGIVGITGAYTGSITGIMLCLMFFQARKKGDDKPAGVVKGGDILVYIVIAFFVLGIVMQTLAIMQ